MSFAIGFPHAEMRVVAIYGLDNEMEATKETRILAGDEVFVLAGTKKIRHVLDAIHNSMLVESPSVRRRPAGRSRGR